MPKRLRKATELKGMNIYQDPKHGTILYDWLTKKGYQLTTSDVKWYGLSQGFLPIAAILAYICYVTVKVNLVSSIIIGLIAYLVMRMLYRFRFLNNLPCVENYARPNKGNIFLNASKNYSKSRLILLVLLALALIGVTVAYLLTSNPQGPEKIGIYILLAAAIAMFGFATISLIIKKNNE